MGIFDKLLGIGSKDPVEECADELWRAYDALLPECTSMIVEPAVSWTEDMERPPLVLDGEGQARMRRELVYYLCFLSTLHCQEMLSDWRPFLDRLHARALEGLAGGSQDELNARYASYTRAYDSAMGRNWHAVNRLFIERLQDILGDVPRLLWSSATFAMLDLSRQAAREVLERLPGKAAGDACPACGRSGCLERVAFGEAGSVVVCNSCLEHPTVREKLIGDLAALFRLHERGNPRAPELIRQMAARHRLGEPEIAESAPSEQGRGDNPS